MINSGDSGCDDNVGKVGRVGRVYVYVFIHIYIYGDRDGGNKGPKPLFL